MAGKLIAGVENTELQQNTVQTLTCALLKWTLTAVKGSKEGAGGYERVRGKKPSGVNTMKLLLCVSLGA